MIEPNIKSVVLGIIMGAVAATIFAVGCSLENARSEKSAPTQSTGSPVVVAAGDIASCSSSGDEATAKLLTDINGPVVALGDEAYESGSAEDFGQCYDPTWGQFKNRTHPVPGNHEYMTPGAEGYFDYFGGAAGDSSKGYYSYNIGRWHVVALNSNECMEIRGCNASSDQVRWLKADLDANKEKACTLAYMHHPRFSSGEEHGSTPQVEPLWDVLYESGADVVLSAHEHNYERFVPQDPAGREEPGRGVREFVVGTGGKSHYEIETTLPNSQIHNDDTYGVLILTLYPKDYDWRFMPVENETFTDSGRERCH